MSTNFSNTESLQKNSTAEAGFSLHRLDLDRRTESAFALPGRLAGRPPVSQVRQLIRYPDTVRHSPSAMKRSLPITLTLPAVTSQRARAAGRTALDDDIDFVLALIEEAKKRLSIDPDRIFAVGGSNGGMFTWELGQKSSVAHPPFAPSPR